jgi:hypothetical protein
VRVDLRVDLTPLLGGADRQQVAGQRVLGIRRVVRPAVERFPHQHSRPLLPSRRRRDIDVGEQPVDQRLVGYAGYEVVEVLLTQPLAHCVIQAPLAAEVIVERPRAHVRAADDPLDARAGESVLRELAHRGAQYPLGCRGRHPSVPRCAPMLVHQPMIGMAGIYANARAGHRPNR